MNKKLMGFALILATLVFAIFIAGCTSNPTATLTPTSTSEPSPTPTSMPRPTPQIISEEEAIQQLREEIHKIEIASQGIYYKSWAFLDRMEEPLDTKPLSECAPSVHTRTADENGRIISKTSAQSFVIGAYIFSSKLVLPSLEIPPPPPILPGMSQEEYEKLLKEYNESFPDPSTLTTQMWIEWGRTPVDPKNEDGNAVLIIDFIEKVEIENEAIAEELEKLGIVVFKRSMNIKPQRPRCLNPTLGEPNKLEKGDILAQPEHIEFIDSFIKGSYMSKSEIQNGFYFQGSVIKFNRGQFLKSSLGSPVFAFRKSTQKPEVVGIITLSGDPLETRGLAARIDYILELMELAGIDVTNIDAQDEP